MIEVEMKLPVADRRKVAADLEKLGFVRSGLVREEDEYFDNDAGQIRKCGEALRIRRIENLLTGKSDAVITFKGRKVDSISMSRRELETGVEDAAVFTQILEAIGFQIIPPAVRKTRQEYVLGDMNACVDQVQDLGDFLELEIVIAEEADREDALQRIEEVLRKLGYGVEDTTRNSYLSMLQHVEDD